LTNGIEIKGQKRRVRRTSVRSLVLMFFERGTRPSEVARRLDVKPETAYRYYQQWKKLPRYTDQRYQVVRSSYRHMGGAERREVARVLADGAGLHYRRGAAAIAEAVGAEAAGQRSVEALASAQDTAAARGETE